MLKWSALDEFLLPGSDKSKYDKAACEGNLWKKSLFIGWDQVVQIIRSYTIKC